MRQDPPSISPRDGIITTLPQFAAAIHDGYATREHRTTGFAGFVAITHAPHYKEPTRVGLLGELDPTTDLIAIHRLIVDGQELPLTRNSLDLALAYAANLTAQIHAGIGYDPTQALQQARAARPLGPQSQPAP